jgi:Domain of unknown function (DUF1840)
MHYVFKSKAAGDLLMTQAVGDELLRLIGREPAPQGILEAAALPAALRAIEQALAREPGPASAVGADAADPGTDEPGDEAVSLPRRAWPFVEMMKRAHAENVPIVWGV